MDIDPHSLLGLIEDNAPSLREVYLIDVYLKVSDSSETVGNSLWIGFPDQPRPAGAVWVAQSLRDKANLHLDILRATGLGYDMFNPASDLILQNYDLTDLSGMNRSFDQRFVEAVFSNEDTLMTDPIPLASPNTDLHEGYVSRDKEPISERPRPSSEKSGDYDAETYQRYHNTTSQYKRCIDGHFLNRHEQALQELQKIVIIADRGMNIISEEIMRSREATILPATGMLGYNPNT